jgi:hypothetical protein
MQRTTHPKCLAVIKLARLIVIWTAYETHERSISRKVSNKMSQINAEERTFENVKSIQGIVQRFMMMGDDENPIHIAFIVPPVEHQIRFDIDLISCPLKHAAAPLLCDRLAHYKGC